MTPTTTPASPAASSLGLTASPIRRCGDPAGVHVAGGGRRAADGSAPAAR
ncbi:hypothetical protein [Brachybacterium sp.]